MVIRDASELEKIDLDSLSYVNAGYYGSVYKYGDKALKVFHSKDYIDMLENEHHQHFLDFLLKLEDKSPILVCPHEIFKNGEENVVGYITNFLEGVRLDSNIGDIDINTITNILNKFYQELVKMDDLFLYDATRTNLILGSELKIIDLDLARFEKNLDVKRKNLQRLNKSIFKAIIRNSFCIYSSQIDDKSKEIADSIIEGEDSLPNLLGEYIEYINRQYFEVKYVKDLRLPYVQKV